MTDGDGDDVLGAPIDPDAPDAEAQRAITSFLLDLGVPAEQVQQAHATGTLAGLVTETALWRDFSRIAGAELAERAGLSEEVMHRARRMLGFADPGADVSYRAREVDMFSAFAGGVALFGEDQTLQLARVLGTSAAAIAEAAISLFTGSVAAPLAASDATDAEFALIVRDAMLAFDSVSVAVDVMLRLHFERAIARLGGDVTVDELAYAIGFVDVVDSTAMSGRLVGSEVAVALRDFDRMSAEAATRHDVRLVKMIGDGAMLAAREVTPLVLAAQEIVAAVDRHPVLRGAKAGVTFGAVAAHDGDYFGQTVNLAARASNAAAPREILLDATAAREIAAQTESAGTYELKGFAEPVPLYRFTGGASR